MNFFKFLFFFLSFAFLAFPIFLKRENLVFQKSLNSKVISISSSLIYPGETFLIKIERDFPPEKIKGFFDFKEIKFSKIGENLVSVLGISVKARPKKSILKVELPNGNFFEKEIEIAKKEFPVTELLVTKELKTKGFSLSKIAKNLAKENEILKKVFEAFTPKFYFKEPFIYPLNKIENVGPFGNIRKSKEIAFYHLGVDLKANVGELVYAVNHGKVVLAQEFFNYGKTIVIDHGMGIFSLYLHLNDFKVKKGELVKRGQIIGLSGNTGYSISPHLHFGIKINGVSVDPLKFIEVFRKSFES